MFDVNSKFLACYGHKQVFIIKLEMILEKEVKFEHECDI